MLVDRTILAARLDTGSLRIFSILAALFAGGALLWGVLGLVHTLTADAVPVTQPVTVTMTDVATDGTASVLSGEATQADLSLAGLSLLARLLLGSGTLLVALVQVMIAVAVVALCRQLQAGRPFVPAIRRLLTASALVALAGGLLGQALYGFGNFQVAVELIEDPTGTAYPMMMLIDSTPIAVGAVLALIATAFTVGERLQRETDGLV